MKRLLLTILLSLIASNSVFAVQDEFKNTSLNDLLKNIYSQVQQEKNVDEITESPSFEKLTTGWNEVYKSENKKKMNKYIKSFDEKYFNSKNPQLFYAMRALAYYDSSNYDMSMIDIQKTLELEQQSSKLNNILMSLLYLTKAKIELDSKDYENTIADADKSYSIINDAEPLFVKLNCLAAQQNKNYKENIKLCDDILKIAKDDENFIIAPTLIYRGLYKIVINQKQNGLEDLYNAKNILLKSNLIEGYREALRLLVSYMEF